MNGWVIVDKVRAALALAVVAFIATGGQALADTDWTDLGVWGIPVGATVAALAALLTPERLAVIQRYIDARRRAK